MNSELGWDWTDEMGSVSQSAQRINSPSDYTLPSTGTYYTRHQAPRAQCHF